MELTTEDKMGKIFVFFSFQEIYESGQSLKKSR